MDIMESSHTLSLRGAELAVSPSADLFSMWTGQHQDAYDPDRNPNGFINFGVAENFAMIPDVVKFVNSINIQFTPDTLSYGEGFWGTLRMRRAMANFLQNNFSPIHTIEPRNIVVAAGITSLCEMLGFTICDPEDGILFPTPIYQGFNWDLTARAKVRLVFTKFDGVDQFTPAAAEKYEHTLREAEARGIRIRALMLCNPHNPVGQCYSVETIVALMKLCQKYKIHLLSDEVYATSVYGSDDPKAVKFSSVLSFDHAPYIDAEYLHVLYGMSKDLACGGLRVGIIYTRNQELSKALRAINMFSSATSGTQQIAASMLEDSEWYGGFLKRACETLAARSRLARQLLDEAGVRYHQAANAGFFLWIDLRPWLANGGGDEWAQEEALLKQMLAAGVFLTNGKELAAEEAGFFRLIFSHDESTLRTGLGRLVKMLGGMNQQAPEAKSG